MPCFPLDRPDLPVFLKLLCHDAFKKDALVERWNVWIVLSGKWPVNM